MDEMAEVQCEICKVWFKSSKGLKEHRRMKHSEDIKSFSCKFGGTRETPKLLDTTLLFKSSSLLGFSALFKVSVCDSLTFACSCLDIETLISFVGFSLALSILAVSSLSSS